MKWNYSIIIFDSNPRGQIFLNTKTHGETSATCDYNNRGDFDEWIEKIMLLCLLKNSVNQRVKHFPNCLLIVLLRVWVKNYLELRVIYSK